MASNHHLHPALSQATIVFPTEPETTLGRSLATAEPLVPEAAIEANNDKEGIANVKYWDLRKHWSMSFPHLFTTARHVE